ncbi:MAG: lysophospholipid acyltransferase family protein [Spirochaetaceae bacterium]|jgi:1-acyl-sn-glycerol-3-phosphate acyltransferase|nr:lysophospholipid acyltransferase family protein [Spirochaetaceae bacterium]
MEPYVDADSYNTPEDHALCLKEKILIGNRKGFYWDCMGHVLKASALAKKGLYTYEEYCNTSWNIFKTVESHGGKYRINGLDNIKKDPKPRVIISNHMSTLETQVLSSLLAPMKIAFVVKESLLSQPLFGPIMKATYPIPVTRENPIEDLRRVMQMGCEYLEKGFTVIVFPEGTRKHSFNPKEMNSLGVKLALRAGVEAVPLALKTDMWSMGKVFKDLGPIHREKPIYLSFGTGEVPTGKGKQQHIAIVDYILQHLKQWNGFIEE